MDLPIKNTHTHDFYANSNNNFIFMTSKIQGRGTNYVNNYMEK